MSGSPPHVEHTSATVTAATAADVSPTIWINGERGSRDGLHLSGRDRGLTLADGLFETMRAHGGTVFRLDRHLARLHHGLEVLEIVVPSALREWVLSAVRSAAADDVSVRLTVTRGVGEGGLMPSAGSPPTVIVAVSHMPAFPSATYDTGLAAQVASGRRNELAMTAGLKTLAYADAIVALLHARRSGADEAIFLDTEGHCSEATASNLFVWRQDVLVTPPLTCGALPGITRSAVLELATAFGMRTDERAFGLDVLLQADESFLTSSLRGIAPLVRLAEDPIGRGTPGAVTNKLAAAYRELVRRECRTT